MCVSLLRNQRTKQDYMFSFQVTEIAYSFSLTVIQLNWKTKQHKMRGLMYKAYFYILNRESSDSTNFYYSEVRLKHNHETVQRCSMGGSFRKECFKAAFLLCLLQKCSFRELHICISKQGTRFQIQLAILCNKLHLALSLYGRHFPYKLKVN